MAITINGTTGVSGVDGSASTPSYQGADTNTGLFYPAADTVSIGTDGSERLRIRSDGNVSIGGTGSSATSLYLQKDISGATSYGLIQSGQFQSGVTNGYSIQSSGNVASGATLSNLANFRASEGTISGTITSQYGFVAVGDLISATNNYAFSALNTAAVGAGKTAYGFHSAVNTATGGGTTYGFYAAGTANNYFAGKVGVGNAASTPGYNLDLKNSTSTTLNIETTGSATQQGQLRIASGANAATLTVQGGAATVPGVLVVDVGQLLFSMGAGTGFQIDRTAVTSPASTDGNVFSGTYTPTLTNTTNIAASTAFTTYYTRVGNNVIVSGRVQIDPTAAGSITLGVSLPIASTISNNCWGTCTNQQADAISVTSDNTNNRASFIGVVADTALRTYAFTFQYQVV